MDSSKGFSERIPGGILEITLGRIPGIILAGISEVTSGGIPEGIPGRIPEGTTRGFQRELLEKTPKY